MTEIEEVGLSPSALSAIRPAIGGADVLKELIDYCALIGRSGETSGFQALADGDDVRCTIVSDHTGQCVSDKKGMHGTTDPNNPGLDTGGSKTTSFSPAPARFLKRPALPGCCGSYPYGRARVNESGALSAFRSGSRGHEA